jgi:basic amino acid/polyamine antiporter, APA family
MKNTYIKKKDELIRNVSCFNATTMVVGTIIGTGIFFKPQAVFNATGTASLGLISWVIGCFLGLCGGLIIAEIGAMIPETGGLMTYLEKIYSEVFGYTVAWAQVTAFYPIRMAASALVFGTQAVALFHLSTSVSIFVSVGLTVWLFCINALGNKASSIFINATTFLKFVPMVLIVIFGVFLNDQPVAIQLFPVTIDTHPVMQGLAISVIATLYATDGWINITDISGEIKNPGKNIPVAIIGGLLIVTVTYLIINVAYLTAMTPAEMAGSQTVASDVAGKLMGPIGGKIVAAGILISIMGSHTGFTRTSWRIPYAMAIRNMLPFSNWFSKINKKTGMPLNCGIYMAVTTIASVIFIRDFNVLCDIGSFTIWFFYTITFVGIFVLRKKWPDVERPYKVPLYPFVPIVGVLGGIAVLVSTMVYQPMIALFSIVLVGIGLPIYYYKKKQGITTTTEEN